MLTIIIGLLYTLWLGSYPLFTPDEARYSEVAREMIATGDYITPRVNGVAFLDKPILYYWLQAAGIHLFGLNEWALRFFPALFGVLGCLITYFASVQLFNRRTGLLSALLLATTPLYFGGAHYADLNLEVAVLISSALLFFIVSTQNKMSAFYLYLAYISAALAFLTKGLIGIVFPIMIIGAWIALTNQWILLKKMRIFSGFLLFFAITAPWYLLAEHTNPAFFHFFFITQQFTRYVGGTDFNNQMPIWFYLPIILIGFLPWSFYFIFSLKNKINSEKLFLFLWIIIIFLFFSIPKSKLIGYIFPVFPPLAILTAQFINTIWDKKYIKNLVKISFTLTVFFLLIVVFIAPNYNTASIKPIAMQLKPLLKSQDEVVTYQHYYQDLPLYLERQITMVANWDAPTINGKDNWMREFALGKQFQNTDQWLINQTIFWQRWHSPRRLFVLMNQRDFNNFKKNAGHYHLLTISYQVVLVSNQ